MHRRQLLLFGAAATGGILMPGATPLEHAHGSIAAIRQAMTTGSQSGQLNALRALVKALHRGAENAVTQADRRSWLAALGEASVLHSQAADDAGLPDESRMAGRDVLVAGRGAGDHDLQAYGWVRIANVHVNHHHEYVGALRCATYAAGASGVMRAKAECVIAKTYSYMGDEYRALSALDRADALLDHGSDSKWATFTPAHVNNYRGVVLSRVGHAAQGEETLRALLMGRSFDEDDQQHLHLLTDLCETYVAMDEAEGAALVGLEIYHKALARGSKFKLGRLRQVTEPLAKWISEPKVYELEAALQRV